MRKILIFTGIIFCLVYFVHRFPGTPDPNAYSRLYQIRAVVEQKTLVIDKMIAKHGFLMDRSVYKNKTYSDKPFGLSVLSIPLYSVYRLFFGNCADNEWMRYLLTLFCVTLPHIIFLMLVYRFYIDEKHRLGELFFVGYIFGTIIFPYSGLFFSHVTGASMMGSAWIIIDKMSDRLNCKLMMVLGALIGFAVICEYQLAIIAVWLFVYLFFKVRGSFFKSPLMMISFFAVFFLPIAVQMFVNYLSFENPFAQGYAYKASAVQALYHSRGFFGVCVPTVKAVWGVLFSSSRGMFYLSPFMLAGVPALGMMIVDAKNRLKGIILAGIILSFTWFAVSVVDWQAGWTVGPRYYLASLPFMLIAILSSPVVRIKRYLFSIIILILVLWSVIHCYFLTSAFPYIPENFSVPLWGFAVPLLNNGVVSSNILSLFGVNVWVCLFLPFLVILSIIFEVFGVFKKKTVVFAIAFAVALSAVGGTEKMRNTDGVDKNIRFEYLYARWGRLSNQLEQLYIITKKMPSDLSYRYSLAELLDRLGFSKLALRHFREILGKIPNHKQARKKVKSIEQVLARITPDGRRIGNLKTKREVFGEIKNRMRMGDYKTAKKLINNLLKTKISNRSANTLLECIDIVEKYEGK